MLHQHLQGPNVGRNLTLTARDASRALLIFLLIGEFIDQAIVEPYFAHASDSL